MKKNKKLSAILLTFALVLSLAACGSSGGSAASTGKDTAEAGKAEGAAGDTADAPAEESSQDSGAVFRTLARIWAWRSTTSRQRLQTVWNIWRPGRWTSSWPTSL